MTVRVVRLGSPRATDEGLRIGTVRRPPRGVAKADFAKDDWYDVWFPTLAPSAETVALAHGARTDPEWNTFARRYRAEMKEPAATHALAMLAALSQQTNFSVGCYCEDEARCHRSLLRTLLAEHGAKIQGTADLPAKKLAREH
ncbi:MAG: DUF488 family protein [Burkholderiaceae bacterium]|nr:DUF488 family protein [Burkholderiaceae bacterium]